MVSHYIHLDDPTLEISKLILKEWKYHFKIQEHFIISYILLQNEETIKERILKEIQKFIESYAGNLVTRNINKIYKKGIRILKKRDLIEESQNKIHILNKKLVEYYGNMIPQFTPEDLAYMKKNYEAQT